jgi:hypothetical protein
MSKLFNRDAIYMTLRRGYNSVCVIMIGIRKGGMKI